MATTKSNAIGYKKILTVVCAVALIALIVVLIVLLVQKDGFVVDGSEVRYYESGEMKIGLVTIDDERYYFDANGVMQRGWVEINGNMHYFRKGDLDKGGDDMGGTMLVNTKATITRDGTLMYYEFDEFGNVTLEVPVK